MTTTSSRSEVLASLLLAIALAALPMGIAVPQALAADYSIGVISGNGTCPAGSEKVSHGMDEEDTYCGSETGSNVIDSEGFPMGTWSRGWTGAMTTYGSGAGRGGYRGGVVFHWCKVDGTQFKPLTAAYDPSTHYAVLKLGAACPPGSEEFTRHFDNEDGTVFNPDNSNWLSGNIWPNMVETGDHANTRLSFCLFRSAPFTMASPPNLGVPYGVFALPSYGGKPFPFALASGLVHSNEECVLNGNQFWGGAVDADARRIVHPIDEPSSSELYGCGSMTVFNVVQMSAGAEPVCGSCGGTLRADGTCSVPTAPNGGQPCGCDGRGVVLCDGTCTAAPCPPSPAVISVVTDFLLSE